VTRIRPWKGLSISSTRKTAPATESAHTSSTEITVALDGANNPKMAKVVATGQTNAELDRILLGLIEMVRRQRLASPHARQRPAERASEHDSNRRGAQHESAPEGT
jgi:hypothetical protein